MIKTMLGLGVLSIPAVFDTLGMIPGVICMLAISAVTTWCAIQVQDFKILHPSVYGVDDAGFLMVGRWGREILYVAFLLCESATSVMAWGGGRKKRASTPGGETDLAQVGSLSEGQEWSARRLRSTPSRSMGRVAPCSLLSLPSSLSASRA